MTLRQLEAFYWAATFGSFSAAAGKLHMTQSALSKRIAELEAVLGSKLFNRDAYRPVLTAQGRVLLEKARRMLQLQSEIHDTVRSAALEDHECRFGVTELVALTWLPDLVAQVRRKYPNAVLEPYVDLSAPLHQKLIDGEIDFAVTPAQCPAPGIVNALLVPVEFALMASPKVVPPGTELSAQLLERLPVLTQIQGSGLNPLFDGWMHGHGLNVRRILGSNSLAAIAGMVVGQLGVAFLPTGYYAPLVRRGDLCLLRMEARMPLLDYYLSYRADETNPLARALFGLVVAACDFGCASHVPRVE